MNIKVRFAEPSDAKEICKLLNIYVPLGRVLPRDEEDILFYIKNFSVAVDENNKICGCVAARDFGNDLLEVRSLVVNPDYQGIGVGRKLIEFIIAKLKRERTSWRLFTLTLQVDFFTKMGFTTVVKELFPDKIWSDCSKCAKKNCCDETAMLLESTQVD